MQFDHLMKWLEMSLGSWLTTPPGHVAMPGGGVGGSVGEGGAHWSDFESMTPDSQLWPQSVSARDVHCLLLI